MSQTKAYVCAMSFDTFLLFKMTLMYYDIYYNSSKPILRGLWVRYIKYKQSS